MTRNTVKAVAVVGACAVLGATAGIAGSAAAPSSQESSSATSETPGTHADRFGRGRGVHSASVMLNKAGTAFQAATKDEGTFKSLDADNLTITEGIKDVTYKDDTLTIPADAKVLRNFKNAKLTDLAAGDRVEVEQSQEGTFVFAMDAAHEGNGDRGTGRFNDGDNAPR